MGAADAEGLTGWSCKSRDLAVAGIRIRADHVMRGLRRQGHATEWYDPQRSETFAAVVFHANFNEVARTQAEALKRRGVRVLLDLCDNHFHRLQPSNKSREREEDIRRMVKVADRVVVPTQTLADIVARECAPAREPLVIPDAEDDLSSIPLTSLERLRQWLAENIALRKLHAAHRRGRFPVLWFGKNGKKDGTVGMADVARLRGELESLDARLPLHLTVISDSEKKFEQLDFEDWKFPVIYAPWGARSFGPLARAHAVALIPVTESEFTRGKSENRLITAFAHGLAVVADPIPSYRPFSAFTSFGDWLANVERYARDPQLRLEHVEAGRKAVRDQFNIDVIARRWWAAISEGE